MKKLFLFLLIIILVLGGFIYFIFLRQDKESPDSLSDFFPIGAIRDIFNDSANNPINQISDDLLIESLVARKIVPTAVAGFDLINLNDNQSLVYTDKNTGHIYFLDLKEPDLEAIRISNITMAGAIDSVFSQDNENLYAFLKNELGRISLVKIPLTNLLSGDSAIQSTPNILSLPSISPDGSKIFFLESFNGGVLGILANPNLSDRQIVWESSLSSWHSKWINNKTIALNQPPSYHLSGNLYFLDTETKISQKILNTKNGLTALSSPNKKYIFYSESLTDNITNTVKDLETNTETVLGIKTLADKCTWTAEATLLYCAVSDNIFLGQYPDDWYQGKVSFSNDNIWGYIPETNQLFRFINLNKNIDIDKFNIHQSNFKDTLIFRDKKDLSLWILELVD